MVLPLVNTSRIRDLHSSIFCFFSFMLFLDSTSFASYCSTCLSNASRLALYSSSKSRSCSSANCRSYTSFSPSFLFIRCSTSALISLRASISFFIAAEVLSMLEKLEKRLISFILSTFPLVKNEV